MAEEDCFKEAAQQQKKHDGNNVLCNMSKTSASVSSGVPDTEKQMKARGCWPSAFIVSGTADETRSTSF